jgi:hypothetical protein
MDNELLGRQSAKAEARALLPLVGKNGDTVETLRALICVQPKTERALRAFAQAHPEEAYFVDRVLKFRNQVAREFEALVRAVVIDADTREG